MKKYFARILYAVFLPTMLVQATSSEEKEDNLPKEAVHFVEIDTLFDYTLIPRDSSWPGYKMFNDFEERNEQEEEKRRIEAFIEEEIDFRGPIQGLIFVGQSFKNLARLPKLRIEEYSTDQIDYIIKNLLGLGMVIQMADRFPHELRDIDANKLEEALKKFKGKEKANSREAKKSILYAQIPWRFLESISRFTYRCSPDYKEQNKQLLMELWPQLIDDFKVLLNYRNNILKFHLEDYLDEELICINHTLPPASLWSEIPNLTLFGRYCRDYPYLCILSRDLEEMLNVSVRDAKDIKIRYAMLRVLFIMGEIGKYTSNRFRSPLNEDLLKKLADLRNSFHKSQPYERLITLVRSSNKALFYALKHDFLKIKDNMDGLVLAVSHLSELQDLYYPSTDQSYWHAITVNRLCDHILNKITPDEEEMLLRTVINRRSYSDQKKRLMEIIYKGNTKDTKQEKVFSLIESCTPLSQSEKKKLQEAYKKRRQGKIITDANLKDVEKIIKSFMLTEDEATVKVKALITGLPGISLYSKGKNSSKKDQKIANWPAVKKELEILGIDQEEDQKVWEKIYLSLFPTIQKLNVFEKIGQRIDNIEHALKDLETLYNRELRNQPDQLTAYWADPKLNLAVEFLISCFREHAQQLRGMLADLNGPFEPLLLALDCQIEHAKELLHLHEASDVSGLTSKGRQFMNFQSTMAMLFQGGIVNTNDGGIQWIPALHTTLQDLSSIVKKMNTNFPASASTYGAGKVRPKESSTERVSGIDASGLTLTFVQEDIAKDNNCAFHCLGLTREQATRQLMDNAHNEHIRFLVAPEIFQAMKDGDLPASITKRALYKMLHSHFIENQTAIDNEVRRYKAETEEEGNEIDLIQSDPKNINLKLNTLRDLINRRDHIENQLWGFARSKQIFTLFVKDYIGVYPNWLTYLPNSTSSMDALAALNNSAIVVWRYDSGRRANVCVHSYSPHAVEKVIHMHHTNLGTHFNLLHPALS